MDANSGLFIERLWEQILYWNPKLIEKKLVITEKLQDQLFKDRAVVRIESLEVKTNELAESCVNKINELKRIMEKANGKKSSMELDLNSESECKEGDVKVEVWEESDSDEQLSVVAKKCQLALRKSSRKRKKSSNFKYVETSPVKPLKQNRSKGQGKRVISYFCEENAVCNRDSEHSLYIEIPRLFLQGHRQRLLLGNKLAEETFADLVDVAKQKNAKYPNCSMQNAKKTQKKKKKESVTAFCSSSVDNSQQTQEEAEFSQLVRELMPRDGSEEEETWQAVRDLERINNNDLDKLDTQQCLEPTAPKRSRKSPKPSNKSETTKVKRGRKPKNKDSLLVQPPTKSNLAQYVENFSNDFGVPGSATPAASSTMSQPLVSSTTHNFEFIDQQDPAGTVMCYIEGDWANGGACQLVTTNVLSINDTQFQAENINGTSLPFQENILDGNLGLPISVPLNSLEFSNLTQSRPMQQSDELQNGFAHPIINIQIPNLPVTTTTTSSSAECNGIQPPFPAHIISNYVLDLSVKSKPEYDINAPIDITTMGHNSCTSLKSPHITYDDDATVPLDLSLKSAPSQGIASTNVAADMEMALPKSNYVVEQHDQYYDLARCLDELEFDSSAKPHKGKDMPLLDCGTEHEDLIMRDSTKTMSIDSNYITMNEDNSEIQSCILGQEFQFANQSTKEIFDNLLDIGSLTVENEENMNRNDVSFLGLDSEAFDYNDIQSSTLNLSENVLADQIDNKKETNDQRMNMDDAINDGMESHVNIKDTSFYSSSMVDKIESSLSEVAEKSEARNNEGNCDSQQKYFDDVTKAKHIPVKNFADTSSTVEETIDTVSCTSNKANKFIPRILKRCHTTVNKLDPTKDIELITESDKKPHDNLEKMPEELNETIQEDCVFKSEQISDLNLISKENNCFAQDVSITGYDVLNQSHYIPQTVLANDSEDNEDLVVRHESFKKNDPSCVTESTNNMQLVDKCNYFNLNGTFNEFDLKIDIEKSDKKSCNMEFTQSKTTTNNSSSKKLDESSINENDMEKQEIEQKELHLIASSKKCKNNLQLSTSDKNSHASIEKIVFSVKRVGLSEETNCLDYTFENCESNRKREPHTESSLIAGDKSELLADENTRVSSIEIDSKEPVIQNSNVDLRNVPYYPSNSLFTKNNVSESKKLSDDISILNLTKNSDKEHSNKDVYDIEMFQNECTNDLHVSSFIATQNAEAENASSCQHLEEIRLGNPPLVNTCNHDQTVKHLRTFSGDCITNDCKYEENMKKHNTYDENKCSLNSISVVIPKSPTLALPNMSLLEMESKLEEDNLDFEEDFDDALSLEASSFNSPNESRFMEALVYESDSSTIEHEASTPSNTIASSNSFTNPTKKPSLEDLKEFKIPKLKNVTSAELNKQEGTTKMSITCKDIAPINHFTLQPPVRLEKNSIRNEGKIVRKEDIKIEVKSKVFNPATIEHENITRTIKNENADSTTTSGVLSHNHQAYQSQPKMHQTINCIINNNSPIVISQQPPLNTNSGSVVSNENIQNIFGVTCLPYLVDLCFETHCQHSHQFNDNDTVFNSLNLLNVSDLTEAYYFMYKHQKLYKSYFLVFCNLYTIRRDRGKLLCMAIDCERYPQYSEYLIVVYEGLVLGGLSRVNACRHILQRVKGRSTMLIDALVAVIIKSDWTMFPDYIDSFALEEYNFSFSTLEHMSEAVLRSNNNQLKDVFCKCVQMLRSDDTALLLTSPNVMQCLNLLIEPRK